MHIAEVLFCIIALDIHDHTISELKAVVVVGGDKRFFLEHAASNHRLDLRVFCLYRRLTSVKQGNLPIASGTRPLTADDELVRFSGFLIDGIGDDSSHNRTDETDTHYNNDFCPFVACRLYQRLNALKLGAILIFLGNRKFFICWTY